MTTYETTIERNDKEIEIEVDFDFQPAEKMTYYTPGCDASIEINCTKTVDGKEIELIKEEEDHLEEEIMDWADNYDDERWDY